jgi:hypothetical protein
MGSIGGVVETSAGRSTSELRLHDAWASALDEVAALLAEVYAVFRGHLPPQAWERYVGEILDVRSRLGDSELIVAERAGGFVGTIGFYADASRSPVERWPQRWASIRTLGCTPPRTCPRQRALYRRLGCRRAPEFDIEIGEMFTGRSLPPGQSWQAQAYRLDLEGV